MHVILHALYLLVVQCITVMNILSALQVRDGSKKTAALNATTEQ